MGTACVTHVEKSDRYRILMGKLEGKKPFERTVRRWEYYGRVGLKENARALI
jgi:hypothetical protein